MNLKKFLKTNKLTKNLYLRLALLRRHRRINKSLKDTIISDFKKWVGYDINLTNPQTFNEKLQWLKLNYRNPIATTLVDKIEVRGIIGKLFGEEYLIETYGTFNNAKEINFEELPDQFVLKPNHSSGRVIICTNKNELDIRKTKNTLNNWLKENYYFEGGEWIYKNIKPRIICEKLLDDNIEDYKIFCFNGKPQFTQVISNRKDKKYDMNYYDLNWKEFSLNRKDEVKSNSEFQKPKNFDKMIHFSKLLSKDFPFVRVDFYEVNNKLFFGELTFYPMNGFIPFENYSEDLKWGKLIQLPSEHLVEVN